MTKTQKDNLVKAGRLVKDAFPEMSGSVKFNLQPGRKNVNVKIEYNVILENHVE